MTNFTPEMIEKAKTAKSAELSDDELDNVAGGTAVQNAFNLQLNGATSVNFIRADALIAREMYCENCKKNTVFHIPKSGEAYCSVCNQLFVSVVEAPFMTE